MITKQKKQVRMIPMWLSKNKFGGDYLRGKLSQFCSMTVFLEYAFSNGSRTYTVYLGSLVTEKGRKRKTPVYIKYAEVCRMVDENGNEYLSGEIANGCYLRFERQSKIGKSEKHPDYIAYICEKEKNIEVFNIDSTGDEIIGDGSDDDSVLSDFGF